MKIYILTLMLLLSSLTANALEVVYPKQNNVVIASPSTFFIGNADTDKTLTVNGQIVQVHKSGGFAYPVKLEAYENQFEICSGDEKQTFKIINPLHGEISGAVEKPLQVSKNFDVPVSMQTAKDNAPLRTTPVNAGINRIAHYEKGIPLNVIGEENEFYKVLLNSSRTAWIAKEDVISSPSEGQAVLLNRTSIENPNYYIFKIDFDKKVPYVIEGGYPFVVNFYNLKDKEDSTFTFTFPLKQKLAGYSGYFDGNSFILKIRKFPEVIEEKPLKDLKIVIDAGHGGDEFGAIGCLGHKEKDINLSIARNLYSELKSRGANVFLTRNTDEYMGLIERVNFTNENDAMIFLSIHANALPDSANPLEHSGIGIYYYYNQAKPLADSIMKEMDEQLPLQDDMVRRGSFAVVRNTNALSVLIEVGYLINPEDNSWLIDKSFQKNAAKAIADGVEEFMKK